MNSNHPSRPSLATKITYMYRDAGNYKFYASFLVDRAVTLSDLNSELLHGEYFVPEKIGLNSLVPEQMNQDDHLLHEFISTETIYTDEPTKNAADLLNRIRHANEKGWFSANSNPQA